MKRAEKLQPPVLLGPSLRISFAEQDDELVETAIDRWLRSIGEDLVDRRSTLDSPGTPEDGRRS